MDIVIDESNFPIVTIVFPEKLYENYDIDGFFQKFLDLYNKESNFTIILFLDKIKFDIFKYFKKIVNFRKKLKDKQPLLDKSILIINGVLSKLFIRLMFNIQKPFSITYIIDKRTNNLELSIKNILQGNNVDNILKFNN